MDNKIVITDSETFKEIIGELELTLPTINSIFNNQNNSMSQIKETEIWRGKAQQIITEKYEELSTNYNPIEESSNVYINFLKSTIQEYEKTESLINQDIDTNINNLNIN